MVSSSQVGDAVRTRCDEADAVPRKEAATVSAIRGSLEFMARPAAQHLAIHPAMQGLGDLARFDAAGGWPRRSGLRPI